MNFKFYDIFSSLIPGFLLLIVGLELFEMPFKNDLIIPYTSIAFLLGYLSNTLSSWLEDFYHITWSGKPSDRLLEGKDIWKVRFYQSTQIRELLSIEAKKMKASNDELFSIAKMYVNQNNELINDFSSSYAFSRSILTVILLGSITLIIKNYDDFRYYLIALPLIIIVWLRCKQRAYYYSREILTNYLHFKNSKK